MSPIDNDEQPTHSVSIGDLLRTIVQIRALGEDDGTSQSLLGQILSERPFRLARMSGNDSIARRNENDNDMSIEESESGNRDDGEGNGYDDLAYDYRHRPPSKTPKGFPPVTVPQDAGLELLRSGEFGRTGLEARSRKGGASFAKAILSRRSRLGQTSKQDIANDMIPNTNGTAVASLNDNIYCGQYSTDSSFYYTCSRDFRLHIYDTTAPLADPRRALQRPTERLYRSSAPEEPTTMKVIKVIQGVQGGWTITDAHLSPDNERIIYSSLDPTVHMTTTLDLSTTQIPISFADPYPTRHRHLTMRDSSIWSCKFSADGNEIVAGGDGKIFVYDLLANRRTVKINAHRDDVNSCCWADAASGNVLISASDDTFLKVWDRRSLGSSQKPSGVLIGHTEGITNVSAKGDGRYVISNGKDQALRLWDLRRMRTNAECKSIPKEDYRITDYDYRYGRYPKPKCLAHPLDCSVLTYRGHAVLQTLIRCHFSPAETTGGRYIYSGSADGRVHIWSLDGRVVQVLDRRKSHPMPFNPSDREETSISHPSRAVCVRDVSWHSKEPVLMSVGWSSGHGASVVMRHEWKGLLKMQGALEDLVEKQRLESQEQSTNRSGGVQDDTDSDDVYMSESEEEDDE